MFNFFFFKVHLKESGNLTELTKLTVITKINIAGLKSNLINALVFTAPGKMNKIHYLMNE